MSNKIIDNVAVVFGSNGNVKIYHGINPDDYAGRKDVLINPVIPQGVPPHMWVQGNIIGTKPAKLKRDHKVLLAIGASLVLHLFIHFL
jgi:hypothetical protein